MSWSITALKTSTAYIANPGEMVQADPTSGVVTITLPLASTCKGRKVAVCDATGQSAVHTITVGRSGADTIGGAGATTKTITTASATQVYTSDGGTNWNIGG